MSVFGGSAPSTPRTHLFIVPFDLTMSRSVPTTFIESTNLSPVPVSSISVTCHGVSSWISFEPAGVTITSVCTDVTVAVTVHVSS